MEEKDFNEEINNQFEEYQRLLEKQEMRLKYNTHIEVPDEFFSLINEITGNTEELSLL